MFILIILAVWAPDVALAARAKEVALLNVSYDPTREFYAEFNAAFVRHWQETTGQNAGIRQSHAGSGKQARAVIDGLEADVVTLALACDIDAIAAKAKVLPRTWQARLPHNSCPYTSTIVFLVRKGNPKHIRDWDDLARPGISVVTPNPKTSGGARWNYLAAFGYELKRTGGDQTKAADFLKRLFANVAALDAGARGSAVTFLQRNVGDVLIAWENEALLAVRQSDPDRVELVVPSISILAEPPVALIDQSVKKHKNETLAAAYLGFLYSETGQALAAKYYFRPSVEPSKYAVRFKRMDLFTIADVFGSWENANRLHFADGGTFDRIYQPKK